MRRSGDKARPVAVVTGASAGVGRATVIEFAWRGYDVALRAHGREGLQRGRKDVEAVEVKALVILVDTADCDGVLSAAGAVMEK